MADLNPLQQQYGSQTQGTGYHNRTKAPNAFQRLTNPFMAASRPTSSAGIGIHSSPSSRNNTPTIGRGMHNLQLDLESPLIACSGNQERDRAVVAGRELLKILKVVDTVIEVINLRLINAKQKANTNSDVAWGTQLSKNIIATANTHGMVCLYDLLKGGKIERVLNEHNRSVHKISFNPVDGRTLLSGSQDGLMKLWDTRQRQSRCTMAGRCDAVRDVQFNESRVHEFAAAFDNGSIQMWDIRNDSNYVHKINAHTGSVFSINWHPDGRRIASGARDKAVKVWDFSSDYRQKPKHAISTMASVAQVLWRPHGNKVTEIATSAINHDYRINVWDIKRPFVSSYTLEPHDSNPTRLLWRDENIIWSIAKDNKFVQSDINCGVRTLNMLSHSAFAWNVKNEFTFASQARRMSKKNSSTKLDFDDESGSLGERRRSSRAPSFKSTKALSQGGLVEEKVETYRPEQMCSQVRLPIFDEEPFRYMARNYHITVPSTSTLTDICMENSRVAWEVGKYRTGQTWKILGTVVSWEDQCTTKQDVDQPGKAKIQDVVLESNQIMNKSLLAVKNLNTTSLLTSTISASATPRAGPVAVTLPIHTPDQQDLAQRATSITVDEALCLPPAAFGASLSSSTASTDGGETSLTRRNSEAVFGESPDMNETSIGNYVPVLLRASTLSTIPDNDASFESDKTIEDPPPDFLDPDLDYSENTKEDGERIAGPIDVGNNAHSQDQSQNFSTSSYDQSFGNPYNASRECSFGLISDRTSSSMDEEAQSKLRGTNTNMLHHIPMNTNVINNDEVDLANRQRGLTSTHVKANPAEEGKTHNHVRQEYGEPNGKPWNSFAMMEQLLDWYCELGDVQMCATLALLFNERMHIDERRVVEWLEGYIDLLRRHKLFAPAALITKLSTIPIIREKGETNVFIHISCLKCNHPLDTQQSGCSWFCESCQTNLDGCIICHGIVKGNWVMCQGCSHGGHESCLRSWHFGDKMDVCAAVGCLHECLGQV